MGKYWIHAYVEATISTIVEADSMEDAEEKFKRHPLRGGEAEIDNVDITDMSEIEDD